MRHRPVLLAALVPRLLEAQSSVPVVTVVVHRSCGVVVGSPSILSPSTYFAPNATGSGIESVINGTIDSSTSENESSTSPVMPPSLSLATSTSGVDNTGYLFGTSTLSTRSSTTEPNDGSGIPGSPPVYEETTATTPELSSYSGAESLQSIATPTTESTSSTAFQPSLVDPTSTSNGSSDTLSATMAITSSVGSTTTCAIAAATSVSCPASNGTIFTPEGSCIGAEDSYMINCGNDFAGVSLLSLPGIQTVEQCVLECSDDTNCIAVAYDTSSGMCYERSTIASNATANENVVFAFNLRYGLAVGMIDASSGVTTSTSPVTSSTTASASSTTSSMTASGTAIPIVEACPRYDQQNVTVADSGVWHIDCDEVYGGRVLSIPSRQKRQSSAETCLESCESRTDCEGFSYYDSQCTLYSTISDRGQTQVGAISAQKMRASSMSSSDSSLPTSSSTLGSAGTSTAAGQPTDLAYTGGSSMIDTTTSATTVQSMQASPSLSEVTSDMYETSRSSDGPVSTPSGSSGIASTSATTISGTYVSSSVEILSSISDTRPMSDQSTTTIAIASESTLLSSPSLTSRTAAEILTPGSVSSEAGQSWSSASVPTSPSIETISEVSSADLSAAETTPSESLSSESGASGAGTISSSTPTSDSVTSDTASTSSTATDSLESTTSFGDSELPLTTSLSIETDPSSPTLPSSTVAIETTWLSSVNSSTASSDESGSSTETLTIISSEPGLLSTSSLEFPSLPSLVRTDSQSETLSSSSGSVSETSSVFQASSSASSSESSATIGRPSDESSSSTISTTSESEKSSSTTLLPVFTLSAPAMTSSSATTLTTDIDSTSGTSTSTSSSILTCGHTTNAASSTFSTCRGTIWDGLGTCVPVTNTQQCADACTASCQAAYVPPHNSSCCWTMTRADTVRTGVNYLNYFAITAVPASTTSLGPASSTMSRSSSAVVSTSSAESDSQTSSSESNPETSSDLSMLSSVDSTTMAMSTSSVISGSSSETDTMLSSTPSTPTATTSPSISSSDMSSPTSDSSSSHSSSSPAMISSQTSSSNTSSLPISLGASSSLSLSSSSAAIASSTSPFSSTTLTLVSEATTSTGSGFATVCSSVPGLLGIGHVECSTLTLQSSSSSISSSASSSTISSISSSSSALTGSSSPSSSVTRSSTSSSTSRTSSSATPTPTGVDCPTSNGTIYTQSSGYQFRIYCGYDLYDTYAENRTVQSTFQNCMDDCSVNYDARSCPGGVTYVPTGQDNRWCYQKPTWAYPRPASSNVWSAQKIGYVGPPKCPDSNQTVYTAPDGSTWRLDCNIDYPGYDTTQIQVSTWKQCIDTCAARGSSCRGADMVWSRSPNCYLKSATPANVATKQPFQCDTAVRLTNGNA